jgi:hypothetical protein
MLVQRTAFQVEAWQTGSGADWASYRMVVSRRGSYFWGSSEGVAVHDHNGHVTYWAAPGKTSWKYFADTNPAVGNWYRLYDSRNGWQALSWKYYNPQQPGYVAAASLTYDRTVGISRGNNRQGSKTINIGIQSAYSDSRFLTCRGDLQLFTSKIADPSNVVISVTPDGIDVTDRYIRVSASFTNPEGYYTGNLYHNGNFLGSTAGSISKNIPITTAMFETTQNFSFVITGKDGVSPVTKTASCKIEPSGVGIWYKQNNAMKEVFHVYYKNKNGEMIEVTEAWAKKNNQIIKTVK